MQKTFTTKEILEYKQAIAHFFEHTTEKLPVMLTWRLAENGEAFDKIAEKSQQERMKHMKQLIDAGILIESPAEQSGNFVIRQEPALSETEKSKFLEFVHFVEELDRLEHEISIQTIPYSLIAHLELEPKLVRTLRFMVTEPEEASATSNSLCSDI